MRTAAVVMFFLALAIQASAVNYTITDLGSFSGMTAMIPVAISDAGYIAGRWHQGSEDMWGFVWHNGATTDVRIGDYTGLVGINDSGQAVGTCSNPDEQGIIWQNGTVTVLPTLGGEMCNPWDINNAGQITGDSGTADGGSHGFIYQNGSMTNTDPNDGWTSCYPVAINEHGDTAGWAVTQYSVQHAFMYDGAFHDLGVIAPLWSEANDINDLGWVVGRSDTESSSHAFLWRNAAMEDLGSFNEYSIANGVNNLGQVVGVCYGGSHTPNYSAFIWRDGVMSDLNGLVALNSGWVLVEATAVNNLGQIVGIGKVNNQYRGFLLTAVPEPSGILALAIGVAGVVGLAWRRSR
ncbi:MAG TPA: PEP-CTERM sorting domain-containing protein [Armatimonadota bacterium]|nr:PEP-CTERM sorting domain-containing protein [Armatimonadota bacterium]